MIPLTLTLHNFMPYRDPAPLDFSGIHIACLSGENGAGKSALLDAITWALWGEARARRDDDLIHQGQTEMSVSFTFELGGDVYRVARSRKSGGRGQSLLDIQVRAPDGAFHTIAEPSIRETQAKINHLLHLNYTTFINSSFLLQNRADEFTVKTAAQRKQVLADILELGKWECYEQAAKDKIKRLDEQIQAIDARLQEAEQEIARRPQYEAELQQAQQAALELAEQRREAEEALHRLMQATLELQNAQAQLADLQARQDTAAAELEHISRERTAAQAKLDEFQRTLTERDQIQTGYAALQAARAANDALNEKLGRLIQLNEHKNRLEAAIADVRRAVETQAQLAAQTVRELEARMADLSLESQLTDLQTQIQTLEKRVDEAETLRAQLAELTRQVVERRAHNATLKRDMDALKKQIAALQSIGAVCPTCGRALSDDERARLLDEWQTQGKTLGDTWRENDSYIKQATQQQNELETTLAQIEADNRQAPTLHKQLAALEVRYSAAIEAAASIEDKRAIQHALEQRLADQDYAQAEQTELTALRNQLYALGYDADAHQCLRDEIARLAEMETRKHQLDSAKAGMAEMQAQLIALEQAQARWQDALAADQARRAELEARVANLHAQLADAARVQQHVEQVRYDERIARERLGAAQQKIAACDALARQRQLRLAERARLAADKGLYEELRLAFGKKGVPALIIETAIPEIEDEANALLARITGGRMHVRFDTQRESVKGETIETLDIKIADELGTRPYENFSGGEQFRINFAIRIALSKLLARRAGAQLQTLIIDEGFGALDSNGREQLVAAINAIQEDFARILVITHIDELRESFPARIEIAKTPNGPQFNIV